MNTKRELVEVETEMYVELLPVLNLELNKGTEHEPVIVEFVLYVSQEGKYYIYDSACPDTGFWNQEAGIAYEFANLKSAIEYFLNAATESLIEEHLNPEGCCFVE